MQKKIEVVIQSATRWTYFFWVLLGFYELQKEGKIKLKFDLSFENLISSNIYTRKIGNMLNLLHEDLYNLNGYVLYSDNTKKYFCIDSADSPFLFCSEDLKRVNCYFKMQCPIDLEKDYFALTPKIHIPWLDHRHKIESENYFKDGAKGERKICENFAENRYKIKPLMVGPRLLGKSIGYKSLKKGYDNYLSARKTKKISKVMCYFGNSKGPKPETNIDKPDFDWERDILGYYKEKITHPNEKRARIAEIINDFGNGYDGRIINKGNSDSGVKGNESLIVPIEDFCEFVSNFEYNFNVSGYRLSIPNRFIESFIVGTGIITDKLSVKWYLPFSKEEVVETVPMGYLKDEDVDWEQIKKDILNLNKSTPQKIIDDFEEKWAPKKVATYMLEEISKS